MSIAIDDIKIQYSQAGYLPNYPPHLISNEEMCNAFIENEVSYFFDNYPLVSYEELHTYHQDIGDELYRQYQGLIAAIRYHIKVFLDTDNENWKDLPDWVYSYMLGRTVGPNSLQQDRHYWLLGIGEDNIEDEITAGVQIATYELSRRWVEGLPSVYRTTINYEYEDPETGEMVEATTYLRPPTMFGEPHVIKQLRLNEASPYFTVMFDSSGGSYVSAQTVFSGSAARRPENPVREGYKFAHWLLDGLIYDFSTIVTRNILLKASWTVDD